jgi:hypothetical protein
MPSHAWSVSVPPEHEDEPHSRPAAGYMQAPPPAPAVQPVAPQKVPGLAHAAVQQTALKQTSSTHWLELPHEAPSAFLGTQEPAPSPSQ